MIRAEVRYNSKLSDIERRFSLPLVAIAQALVPQMLARIAQGRASTGSFSALGAHSTPTPARGLFWVPPDKEQPSGYVVKPKTGKLIGWAGYESYKAYTEALGSPARTFEATRELMQSLRIRVNGPGRVKVAFYGSHSAPKTPSGTGKRLPNTSVAYLASRRESLPMLTPSREEIAAVARLLQSEVGAQVIGEAASAQQIRGLGQRLDRAQRRLSAQARGR